MKTGDSLSLEEYRAILPPFSKRSKYHNKKTGRYDSKKEAKRAGILKLLEKQGLISDLREQVKFAFYHEDQLLMTYIADFTYMQQDELIVEDVKSPPTRANRVYALKRKAMRIWFDIEILET